MSFVQHRNDRFQYNPSFVPPEIMDRSLYVHEYKPRYMSYMHPRGGGVSNAIGSSGGGVSGDGVWDDILGGIQSTFNAIPNIVNSAGNALSSIQGLAAKSGLMDMAGGGVPSGIPPSGGKVYHHSGSMGSKDEMMIRMRG